MEQPAWNRWRLAQIPVGITPGGSLRRQRFFFRSGRGGGLTPTGVVHQLSSGSFRVGFFLVWGQTSGFRVSPVEIFLFQVKKVLGYL